MKNYQKYVGSPAIVAALFASLLFAAPAFAKGGHGDDDNEQGNGNGKDKHSEKQERKEDKREYKREEKQDKHEMRVGGYFQEPQRVYVREYYTTQYGNGRCPPGLAKKNNGCMPPGQAKRWQEGQPLPRGVQYYSVPQTVITRLGPPPAGQRYVRVDSDILLITIGTMMVIDGISGLR
jgi:Ni/Co efflux regulator RcnB